MAEARDTPPPRFVRKERDHLTVLQKRLEWLRDYPARDSERGPEGGYTAQNGFFAGEANALSWALSVIEGTVEPLEVRVERWERKLRDVDQRLGRVERDLEEDE